MSQDPLADAYLAASETMRIHEHGLELRVRAWVRSEVRKALTGKIVAREKKFTKRRA